MLDWKTGLRFRLTLTVVLALLPVFGLFAYSAAENRLTAIELAHASLKYDALLAAASQQRVIERTAQLLADMASGPSIKDTRIRLCVPYLKSLKSQNSDYANLGVLDLDGQATCHALDSGNSAAVKLGDKAFFQQVLKTRKFAVGDYGAGPVTSQPTLGLGVPVYSGDGQLNGVAFAVLDLSAVSKALVDTTLLAGASLWVLDRRNTVLATHPLSHDTRITLGTVEENPLVRAAARVAIAGLHHGPDESGVEYVYAYAPVGKTDTGLFVVVGMPSSAITAAPDAALLLHLLSLLGLSALGVVAAWWLGGRLIILPAKAILKGAEEVTQGDLSARIDVAALNWGELGQIGTAFNRMAKSLQARNSELESAMQHVDRERALRELILDSMSEGVIAVDQSWRCLLFNRAAGNLFPIPELGAVTDSWRDQQQLMSLDGSTIYPLADRPMNQALRGNSIDNWDVLLRSEGHADKILRVSSRPLRDAENQLIGGVSVFNDITDLKAVEDFVRGQQEVLALIAGGATLAQSLDALVQLIQSRDPGSAAQAGRRRA